MYSYHLKLDHYLGSVYFRMYYSRLTQPNFSVIRYTVDQRILIRLGKCRVFQMTFHFSDKIINGASFIILDHNIALIESAVIRFRFASRKVGS